MPNVSDYRKWVTDEKSYLDALKIRTDGYISIYYMSTTGLDVLKAALDNGHVASFATYFRGWVFDVVDDDPGTTDDDAYVGKQIAYSLSNTSGGHGMVIVGYNDHIWLDLDNDSVVDANEKGAFKIANSDGTGWKDGGYCYLAYDVVRNYSTITGSDGDGLIWQNLVRIAQARVPQHEPKLVARITLNHNKRNQVKCRLGMSTTNNVLPTSYLTSKIITDTPYTSVFQGGPYAFSGAAAASEDFTYYLDFTDSLPEIGTARRYYISAQDAGTDDGNLTIKQFELYYHSGKDYVLVGAAVNTPVEANGESKTVWIDWIVGASATDTDMDGLQDSWEAAYFGNLGQGAPDDPDGDGLSNFYEYAVDGDPTNPSDTGTHPILQLWQGALYYAYPQRTDDTNITYIVETTTDLTSGVWTNGGYTFLYPGTSVGENLQWMVNGVDNSPNKKFIRLRIDK